MVRYCYKQIERQQTFEGPLHNNHSEGRTSPNIGAKDTASTWALWLLHPWVMPFSG